MSIRWDNKADTGGDDNVGIKRDNKVDTGRWNNEVGTIECDNKTGEKRSNKTGIER